MYKVGDRVRVVEDCAASATVLKGDEGVVISGPDRHYYKVKMEEPRSTIRDHWFFREPHIEPVRKFRAGDRVRVLEDGAQCANVKRGDVGTFKGYVNDGDMEVEFGDDTWYLTEVDVEPVFGVADVAREATDEAEAAAAKWPSYNSAHEGYGVLLEEVRELEAHVFTRQDKRDIAAMRKEAIQVAAVALRFVADVCDGGAARR